MNIIRLFTDPPTTQISIIAGRTATLADGFLAAIGFIVAILSALILHEIAHGFVAYKCGDNTAKSLGRLSLNPLKHLDLFGTICMLIVGFGWAKPVPINPYNFRNGRKGMFLVSIAGVTTNILLSFIFIGLLFAEIKIALLMQGVLQSSSFVYLIFYLLNIFFEFGAMLNIFFCLFNILPIFPLDGFRILQIYCNPNSKFMRFMTQYSTFILFGLIGIGYLATMFNLPPYFDIFSFYLSNVSEWILYGFRWIWNLVFRIY